MDTYRSKKSLILLILLKSREKALFSSAFPSTENGTCKKKKQSKKTHKLHRKNTERDR